MNQDNYTKILNFKDKRKILENVKKLRDTTFSLTKISIHKKVQEGPIFSVW